MALQSRTTVLSPDQAWIVRRETVINMVANLVIGGVGAAIAHGLSGAVPVRGFSAFTLEFIPQSFMITLVSVLIPGFIAARAVRRGKIAALAGAPVRLVPLALKLAFAMLMSAGAVLIAFFATIGPETPDWSVVMAIKAGYGALIALCVTSVGARAGMSMPRGRATRRRPIPLVE